MKTTILGLAMLAAVTCGGEPDRPSTGGSTSDDGRSAASGEQACEEFTKVYDKLDQGGDPAVGRYDLETKVLDMFGGATQSELRSAARQLQAAFKADDEENIVLHSRDIALECYAAGYDSPLDP